jgi:uncharacterized membrane protein YdjX (TVP38/TMEM64 family)
LRWGSVAAAVLVVGAVTGILTHAIDIDAIQDRAQALNGGVAFALLTVLPLLGFPASVLHVAAGLRWGPVLGLALVSLSILLQLLASYGAVRLWRHRFREVAWLKRVREKIPRAAHPSVCVFALLLPGAPFAAINYVLPLIGVPLRTYLLCCLPLHTLRATITVGFGGESTHFTAGRLALLAVYAVALLGASWWVYSRLRSRLASRPSVADDRTQPA